MEIYNKVDTENRKSNDLLTRLKRIAIENFEADKYTLSSRVSKKSELLVKFSQVEINAFEKLVSYYKQGPKIAIHQKVERLKQLKEQLESVQKKKYIGRLCESIYGSKPTHMIISLPSTTELDSKYRLNEISINRIDRELEFYKLRDKNKTTIKDIETVVWICMFVLLKNAILRKTKSGIKVNNDQFIVTVLNTFIGETVNLNFNKDEIISVENYTKKIRRYKADSNKKFKIYLLMKDLGVGDLFDSYLALSS